MSRVSFSEEEYFPGQFDLWQANCLRSIKGQKGQVALRELEQALLALPEKRLIREELITEDGVCAIGALALYRNYEPEADPECEMEEVGIELGLPRLVAWKIVAMNDEELHRRYDKEIGKSVEITPEERYRIVLNTVQNWLKQ